MKNKLLLVSCALFLFSGTAFAENLLVTKTSGGADEEGTLPYVVANAPGGSVIELSIGDETTVTIPETILIDKNLTIDGKGKTISVAEPGVSNYRIFKIGLYEPEDGAELISLTLKNCTLYGGDGTALVDTETTMATWSATILVRRKMVMLPVLWHAAILRLRTVLFKTYRERKPEVHYIPIKV